MNKAQLFIIESLRENHPVFRHHMTDSQILASFEARMMMRAIMWNTRQCGQIFWGIEDDYSKIKTVEHQEDPVMK